MKFSDVAQLKKLSALFPTNLSQTVPELVFVMDWWFRSRGPPERRCPNVGSMLARRLRRRANIEPTSGERRVSAGPVLVGALPALRGR